MSKYTTSCSWDFVYFLLFFNFKIQLASQVCYYSVVFANLCDKEEVDFPRSLPMIEARYSLRTDSNVSCCHATLTTTVAFRIISRNLSFLTSLLSPSIGTFIYSASNYSTNSLICPTIRSIVSIMLRPNWWPYLSENVQRESLRLKCLCKCYNPCVGLVTFVFIVSILLCTISSLLPSPSEPLPNVSPLPCAQQFWKLLAPPPPKYFKKISITNPFKQLFPNYPIVISPFFNFFLNCPQPLR